jgi:hypothetical protein
MRTPRIAAAATLLAIVAACTTPTLSAPETPTPPTTGAAFDGGLGFGSGGIVAPPDDSVDAGATATTTQSTTCADRGGVGFGSGGFTDPCPPLPAP